MTSQDLDAFRYDAAGMLSGAWLGGVHLVPLYTPSNERLATMRYGRDGANGPWTVHLGTDWTVRDPSGRVLRRFTETPTGSWSWTEDYIYLGDRLLAAEVATPEKTLHFFTDHLGTPRLITGNGGAKVAEHVYSAFGVEITSALQDAERMKFTGHERDTSTLDHMHARAYRPNLGRFLSVDPGRDWDPAQPQSWNMYSYVRNNPMNKVDPNGRCGVRPGEAPCTMSIDVTAQAPTILEQVEFTMSMAWATAEGRGEVGPQQPGPLKLQVPPVGFGGLGLRAGAMRAAQHSANWQGVSLSETITNIAGSKPVIGRTAQKVTYTNSETGMRVIHDTAGNYFRVQNAAGKYVDQFGKPIPANVPLVNSKAKEVGVWRWLREALTHFRNTD